MSKTLVRDDLDWRWLALLSDEELARYDIAAVNLACAAGLPGADVIDIPLCLRRLDVWAEAVHGYTERVMPQFHRRPEEYENSEAYFRVLALITVLQRDLGVRYNPAKMPEDVPFNTADSFIHGVLQGDGGTCATLPVVYAAVGRRLGYPIRLARARTKTVGHLFARWDDPTTGERFNIEASGKGLSTPTDDYYRTGRYELPPGAEADGCFLQSMTPRAELAAFLGFRGWRWKDVKDWRQCVDSWAWAFSLEPRSRLKRRVLEWGVGQWYCEQERRKPAGFPRLLVGSVGRRFPATVPLELERRVRGLTATDNMLNAPDLEERLWEPMRRGVCTRRPSRVVADFTADERCVVQLMFD